MDINIKLKRKITNGYDVNAMKFMLNFEHSSYMIRLNITTEIIFIVIL